MKQKQYLKEFQKTKSTYYQDNLVSELFFRYLFLNTSIKKNRIHEITQGYIKDYHKKIILYILHTFNYLLIL